MKKLLLFSIALLMSIFTMGQSTANYTFSTITTGSLALDMNGNTVDMSTGTTQLVGPSSDATVSTVTSIGFNFILMGNTYTQFSASADGLVGLGSTATSGTTISGGSTASPKIAAMGGDLYVGSTGKVHYKLIGSASNRCLVVEFLNMAVFYSSVPSDIIDNWQVRLYESTGVIEFVYGRMYCGSITYAPGTVGFTVGTTTNTIVSVTTATNTVSLTTVNTNSYAAATDIPNLNSTTNGSRRVYTFTPPAAPTAPTWATTPFTAITATGMTLNWNDLSSNETGFLIYRSIDGGVTYIYVATTAANAISYSATGLTPSTTYYWQVAAVNEGQASAYITNSQATNAGTLSGTKYVGTGAFTPDYATLTAAFTDINTNGLAGAVTLILQSGYVSTGETFPIVGPTAAAVGAYSVTIYPSTTGLSITSANATGTLRLDGSRYVTFDGRVGGTGSTKDLVIANTSTTGYVILFINDASNNMVEYCKIQGVSTSTTGGDIVFSTTTGTTGNDNNTIDNCDIGDGGGTTPTNGIYSSGTTTTTATYNSGNTISNCNIFNYYNSTSTSNAGVGINIPGGSMDWNITGNSFYQTAARTVFGASATHNAILMSSSLINNILISGNYIGGTAPLCAGGPYTLTATVAIVFRGIQLTVGAITPTSIQGNTIQNISVTSPSTSTAQGLLSLVTGSFNCGTITPNTLGSQSVTGSVTFSISGSAAIFSAILAGTGTPGVVNIVNNTIGGITVLNTGAPTTGTSVRGIGVQGAATSYNISGNIIGSTSTANSISISTNSSLFGIFSASTSVTNLIQNNTVVNLTHTGTGTSAQIRGILCQGSSGGAFTTTGNTVRNLTSGAPNVGTTTGASIIGILHTAATTAGQTVGQNTVYGLSNTHATAAVTVTGIYYAGPTTGTNVVARNLVYGLSIVSSSATADMRGINFASGLANVQNNVIRLGYDASGASLTAGILMEGLYDIAGTAGSGIYFNSVYIGGTGVNTVVANTHAFRSDITTNIRTYEDNIFYNARSNATTGGKHYAVRVAGTAPNPAGLTINYNDYLANGTGGTFGFFNISDVANLAAWRTVVGQDLASISGDPLFVAPTAAIPNLNLSIGTPCEAIGLAIASITDDYTGALRAGLSPTDVGAYAGNFAPLGLDMGATALVSPATAGCFTSTTAVIVTIKNFSGAPIDFSVNNVTVTVTGSNAAAGYSSFILLSTGTLLNGTTMDVTLPATIDMTVDGAYTFNSSTLVTGDINPANDALTITRNVLKLNGIYTVGATGANYPTITAAVNAYNTASCITGPITFSLLDALYSASETFPITINSNTYASATNTLTIKPAAGVTVAITGTATSGPLFKILNNYVYIDGSNTSKGTDRNLTITNSFATTPSVILIGSTGTTPIVGVTVKNCILVNGVNTSTAVIISDGTTAGSAGYFNNITIQNNSIQKAYMGIYNNAAIVVGNGSLLITGNDLSTSGANAIRYTGIYIGGADGAVVSKNQIGNFDGTTGEDDNGVWLAAGTHNSIVEKNYIFNLNYLGAGGYGGHGITVSTTVTGSNILLRNNMIYNMTGDGYTAGSSDNPMGLYIFGTQTGVKVYHNSINLYGNTLNYSGAYSYGIYLGTGSTADITDNIIVNNLGLLSATGVASVGIFLQTASTQLEACDYNDIWVNPTGTGLKYIGMIASTGYSTLATWKAATLKDNNSVSGDPMFILNTNLHIQTTAISPVSNAGITGFATDDIDGDPRPNPLDGTPDIGADEYHYAPAAVVDPTGVIATAISSSEIDVAYVKNVAVDPVVILWSLDGTLFTVPSGPPPAIGATFAGGRVLSDGTIASPVPHTPLLAVTHYYYKAFSYHAATNQYSPGVTTDAITLCAQLTDLSENFDAVTVPALPVCWSKLSTYVGGTVTTITTSPNTAPNCVQMYNSGAAATDNLLLITPQITNLGAHTHWLKFAAKGYSTTALSVIVGTMTDPANSATFTLFQTVSGLSATAWSTKYVDFSTYSGTDQYIAFRHPSTSTYTYIYIDDVSWELITPTLIVEPTSLAFGYVAVGTTSAEQTYSLSGAFLVGTAGITVTAPAGFEVSLTTLLGFGSSVVVPNTGPTLDPTNIFVHFKPALALTDYTGNITNTGGSATPVNVAVTGTTKVVYCTSNATSTADEDIFNVTVGTLNNTSTCSTTGGAGSILNEYSNYTSLTPPDLQQGSTNAFSLEIGTCGTGSYSNASKIFIDFNQNGLFTDAGEEVYMSPLPSGSGAHIETGNIIIPVSATLGNTRMRLVCQEFGTAANIFPCGTYSWGETEDYTVNITVATTPTLSTVPTSLDFGYVPVGGTSAPQSYVLTGISLNGSSITVTAPTDFSLCLTSGGTYTSPLILTYSGTTISQTIYVKFSPSVPGVYSGNITNVGGGASTNVPVTGTTSLVYCVPTYTNGGSADFITSVTLGTLYQATTSNPSPYYIDYTTTQTSIPDLQQGSSNSLTLTFGNDSRQYNGVWIDFNKDGIFATTEFFTSGTNAGANGTAVVTLSVPSGAVLGNTRMRIRGGDDYQPSNTQACGASNSTYGQGQDFLVNITQPLALDASTLSIDNVPTVNAPGVILTPKATVKNVGTTDPVTFNVTMTATDGYSSTVSSGPLASGAQIQVTFANWTPANGIWTATVCTQLAGDGNTSNDCKSKVIVVKDLNKQVYAYNAYRGTGPGPEGPTTFNLSTPGTLNSLANQSTLDFVNGGTWANGIWYGEAVNSVSNFSELVTLDPVTGARTLIGSLGVAVNDISYNPVNNTMYAVIGSSLYTVDMTTGSATLVGGSTPGIDYYNIAIDAAGQAYGIDGTAATLGTIDLATGAYTVIGSLGYTTLYAQGMEFDRATGDLYISAEDLSSGWLALANKTTGAAIKLGDFQGGAEITGFAIPYTSVPPTKTLTVKAFLEGLYIGGGAMSQASDELGPHFPLPVADKVYLELHDGTPLNYATIVYPTVPTLVDITTSGIITVTDIPASLSGSYYITIRHRNSIETTSGAPVSFAGTAVTYDFTTAASQAFGSNMKMMGTAVYAIYVGDVNQDGIIDGIDQNNVENLAVGATVGYVAEDVNGDGLVDGIDQNLVENNSVNGITIALP